MTKSNFRALLVLAIAPLALPAQGPDVIVGGLTGPSAWGGQSGISAFSIGTTSCNIGNVPLVWIASTPQHPVIGQNLYRLKDGRFECVGISWLKHGFTALQQNLCGSCNANPNGNALGVGCSDPYSSNRNGNQSGLGPRYEVNPTSGVFPMPHSSGMPPATTSIDRRLQVLNTDLDPSQNAGARYFTEGQYIHRDDAQAGNGLNNASYREVGVSGSGSSFNLSPWIGPTVQQQPAIYAWQAIDPTVQIITLDVPNDGRYTVAYKVTQLAGGLAHYEFAVHNLNSHRAGRGVTINAPCGAIITNTGWRGVPHHSGDGPYSTAPWTSTTATNGVTWNTQTFAQNSVANALYWGTLYNFWFDSDLPPTAISIELFRSGSTPTVSSPLTGIAGAPEYQGNSFSASLDINGVQTNGSTPANVNVGLNTPFTLNFFSFNTGQLWDLGYGVSPLIPRSACAITTPNGQVLNMDITDPTFSTFFGGTLSSGFGFFNFSVTQQYPVTTIVGMQMVIVSPNLPDGIGLSQATRLSVQ